MDFKKLVSLNIAIIGNTDVAETYARAFTSAGHEVHIACSPRPDTLQKAIPDVFGKIHYTTIPEAAAVADFIILATAPSEVREASYWLGDVRRKVIVDVTANVNATDEELVTTVRAIKAITGSLHVIKVFNTQGYESIIKPLFNGARVDMLLLSDSRKAKEITRIMAIEIGAKYFYDFGGSENIPLFNEMTACWRRLYYEKNKNTAAKNIKAD
jgi:8-hydroxy-5-deazaflavin:NADPH oxidoreductase